MDDSYSVVIPVYNAEKALAELAGSLHKVLSILSPNYEIVFVDDYSQDNSWGVLKELARNDNKIKAIKLKSNFGQHNATLCGMVHCKGQYIITMDDDLQHSPEDIPVLIEKMQQTGADAVIAKLRGKKHEWYRVQASSLMRKLNEWLMEKPKGIYLSPFRLIKRETVEQMLKLNSPFPYMPALIFSVTKNVVNVNIVHKERKFGTSNYTLGKMIKLASRLLLNKAPGIAKLLVKTGPVYIIEELENIEGGPTVVG